MIAYKIVEKDGNGYKTLFHGVEKSRKLPTNVWIKAEQKMVKDGSGGKEYLSGFHVFKTKEDAIKYFSIFLLKRRTIIECFAKNLRQKPTNKKVWLADEIYIPSQK